MKVLFLIALCIAAAAAQGGTGGVVANEVTAIIAANSGISVADCIHKCDEIFEGFLDPHDEDAADRACVHQCECQLSDHIQCRN